MGTDFQNIFAARLFCKNGLALVELGVYFFPFLYRGDGKFYARIRFYCHDSSLLFCANPNV